MRKRAAILAFGAVLLILAAIGAFPLYLHYFRYPPAPARLLPQNASAYIYVDLRPIRRVAKIEPGAILSDPEVAAFSQATGIVPERDIDEVAFALLPGPPDEKGQPTFRSTEVFTGRFDLGRLRQFLERSGARVYHRDQPIYEIPREDRTVRVTILDEKTVAVSNTSGPETIVSVIDRDQHLGFPRSGAYRMNEGFKRVPFGAIAWGTVHIARKNEIGITAIPFLGSQLSLPPGAEVVGSARALSSLELRAETQLGSDRDAQKLSDQIATYLTLFRAVQITMGTGGADADAKQLFDSWRVERDGMKVILKADVPFSFVAKLARENQPPAQSRENANDGGNKAKP